MQSNLKRRLGNIRAKICPKDTRKHRMISSVLTLSDMTVTRTFITDEINVLTMGEGEVAV